MIAFNVIDRDGNGLINADELFAIMEHIKEGISKDEAEEMIKEADQDGDGHLNYEEFVKIMMEK